MAKNNDFISFTEYMPELLDQWDWEKNSGIDPYTISPGSAKKFYWKCLNDERHPSFLAAVNKRTRKLAHDKNHGCPVCANREIIPGINDISSQRPDLLKDWDWDENSKIGLFPDQTPPGSLKRAYWKCHICGHEWQSVIQSRMTEGKGCSVCAGKTIVPGVNDMATLHPEILDKLHPTLNEGFDPHVVASSIQQKLAWQCDKHPEHIYWAKPGNIIHGKRMPLLR